MAKQVGPLFITGTIDGIIFYKLNGQYYLRSAGAYKSGKQMRKDPRLKRTMQNADRFGVATKIVKGVYYWHLPPEVRKHGLFGKLTGMVNRWLYKGMQKEEAEEALITYCKSLVERNAPAATEVKNTTVQAPIIQPVVVVPAVAPVAKQPVLHAPPKVVKQPRYLPKWKVKTSGRLQVPKRLSRSRAGGAGVETPVTLRELGTGSRRDLG